jgi:hypothetical protein
MTLPKLKKNFTYEVRVFLLFLVILIGTLLYYYGNSTFSYEISKIVGLSYLEGDLGQYLVRFILFFLLVGIAPFIFAIIINIPLHNAGFNFNRNFLWSKYFWLAFVVVFLGAISGSFSPELQAYYPLSKTLKDMIRIHPEIFVIHSFLYLILYYIPWEMSFRGFLLLPFIRNTPVSRSGKNYPPIQMNEILWLLIPQIAVTVLLHLPHPFSETLGSITFGIIAGMLTVKFHSIIPALLLHVLAGLTLDFFLIFVHTT